MSETNPYDPPPQEEPIHDVPVFPEEDPPQGTESPIRASAGPGEQHDAPDEGDDDAAAVHPGAGRSGQRLESDGHRALIADRGQAGQIRQAARDFDH